MSGSVRRNRRSRVESPSGADEDRAILNEKLRMSSIRGRDRGGFRRIICLNPKALLVFGVISCIVALLFIGILIYPFQEAALKARVVASFPAPKIMDLPMFQCDHRESLYWGTYGLNVYFGICARTTQSLVAGLMWIGVKDGSYFMRHVFQDTDELKTHGWRHHNGRDYGHQILLDHRMTLTTCFLESKRDCSGDGGDWAVQINMQSEKSRFSEGKLEIVHLFFNLADERGNALSLGMEENPLLVYKTGLDVGDWQLHLESEVQLSWKLVEAGNNYLSRECDREVLDKPTLRLVPHIGYVSLFPFIAKIIPPDSWILEKQLDIISDRSTFWSDFGLWYLAKTRSLYMQHNPEHDPPYWRGPIWMNMNYLTLSALHLTLKEGPFRERAKIIYSDLRSNLIRNVVRNYHETGTFWEQYD